MVARYDGQEAGDLNNHANLDRSRVEVPAPPRTPMPADTRGILDPAAMMRFVEFDRAPAGPELAGIIEWFWSVSWDMPAGSSHDQEVLSHPAGNISIGTIDDRGIELSPAEGRVYGVTTDLSRRHLVGAGWTVAARTTVGGLGVVLDGPASAATDRQLRLAAGMPGLAVEPLMSAVIESSDNAERVAVMRAAFEAVLTTRDPALLQEAREVVEVAAVAEADRTVSRVEQLASHAGASVRTLQRLFDRHVGASPAFVIRRWRLIEAAEAARVVIDGGDEWRGWAEVAAELGYADQAHLSRDFRRHLGASPSEYLAKATTPPSNRTHGQSGTVDRPRVSDGCF